MGPNEAAPQARPAEASKPDAVMFPFGFDPGGKNPDKMHRIFDYLEQTMGVPRAFVNDAKLDMAEDGMHWYFCYPHQQDSYLHPPGHPREKQPRYDWGDVQPNGVKFGTLTPDAWRAGPDGERQAPPAGEHPAFNPLAAKPGPLSGFRQAPANVAPHGVDMPKLEEFGRLARVPEAERTPEEAEALRALDLELFPRVNKSEG